MTVSAPEFDPELTGHSAIVFGEVCHAVVTSYGESTPENVTECGLSVDNQGDIEPRLAFDSDDYVMCPNCWPEHIVSDAQAEGDE